jgi:branched-chain amino acid transport system ATP-binding protein
MLAIGRALVTNPALLILDEASEGLAPLIRREIWRVLAQLRDAGLAMLVIDKYVSTWSRWRSPHDPRKAGSPGAAARPKLAADQRSGILPRRVALSASPCSADAALSRAGCVRSA